MPHPRPHRRRPSHPTSIRTLEVRRARRRTQAYKLPWVLGQAARPIQSSPPAAKLQKPACSAASRGEAAVIPPSASRAIAPSAMS